MTKDDDGRNIAYFINEQGYLISKLYPTNEELSRRNDLIEETPPEIDEHQRLKYENGSWKIENWQSMPLTVEGHKITAPEGVNYKVFWGAVGEEILLMEGSADDGILDLNLIEPGKYIIRLFLHLYYEEEVILEN